MCHHAPQRSRSCLVQQSSTNSFSPTSLWCLQDFLSAELMDRTGVQSGPQEWIQCQFFDTAQCDCRRTCTAQAGMSSQKGKAAFEIEIIFLSTSCVRKHNAQTVDQQNKLPQGKQRKQIINNFQYQPYISKELLICLFYGHTWEVLQTCQILALGIHIDASVSSTTEHSLPLSRLLAFIVLKGWFPPNRIQYSDWIDGLSPEKLS